MKTLIVYATKYGATEKAAQKLAKYLKGDSDLLNLKEEKVKNLSDYNAVAIGGSIYMGQLQKEVKEFFAVNKAELLEKKLGLFICCGFNEQAEEQLNDSFPEELLNHAAAQGYFGYEFNLEQMNFFFRMIVKLIAKVDESKSEIKEDNIKEFAAKLGEGKE